MEAGFIRTAAEIDGAWLGAALGRPGVEVVSAEAIGTGQMSLSHRVVFRADGGPPESVVVKLAATDEASRATGVGMGAYRREVEFYRRLANRIGGPLVRCHGAWYDDTGGWFTLVLDDVRDGRQGDQIAGCAVDEARVAIQALARIQAPVLGDLAVGASDYLNQPSPLTQQLAEALLSGFLERYGERIEAEHADVCRRFVGAVDAWAADRRPPLGLVHGDFRLDNILYTGDGCKVVDWQTVSWGPALVDAAYFIGGGLDPTVRRAHERELIQLYHEQLLANGAQGISAEECWEEYRRATFHGILMTVVASMVVQRTERGDEMFMTWLRRNARQILDLDALALLPARDAARPAPLRPAAEDEGRHPPSGELWFNESWYFDAVSDDRTLGVYWRLGRVPNQGMALVTACVTGPDRPCVMLAREVPLPEFDDDRQRVEVDGLCAWHECEEPLRRFRVVVAGTAEAFADAGAVFREEPGDPVPIALDLVWETDGVPYQWRQSTRYEIPCRITGSVRVGEEEVTLNGPGQRDHSWGARDWFAVDWMWNGLHLDDGTHIHSVGVPQMPGYGVGYVQSDAVVDEISAVTASEVVREDGLIESATVAIGASRAELQLEIEPMAFGPILLKAPDGRVSQFPRAMCRVDAGNGRGGVGWIEWNRVQRG
jgi:hypothetical protein